MAENVIRFAKIIDAPVAISVCETLHPVGRGSIVRALARVDPVSIEDLVADPLSEDVRVTLRPEAEIPATVRLID